MPWHANPNIDLVTRKEFMKVVAGVLLRMSIANYGEMAKKLEVQLYKASKSKEEYTCSRTVQARLTELLASLPAAEAEARAQEPQISPEELQKIRQNRLLGLKHAAYCQVQPPEVCVFAGCPTMRALRTHLSQCTLGNSCTTKSCVSSKWILKHFDECVEKEQCGVCGPAYQNMDRVVNPGNFTSSMLVPSPRNPSEATLHMDPRFARCSRDGTGPNFPLSMTSLQLQQHLDSLHVERLQENLFPALRKLMEHKSNAGVFNIPVDPVAQNIPDYHRVIKTPMDFGTVRRRLEDGRYKRFSDFEADIKLTLDNAIKFNPPGNAVHEMAEALKKVADLELAKCRAKDKDLADKLARPRDHRASHEATPSQRCLLCLMPECAKCTLCNRGCLAFEPKVFYCAGGCRNRITRGKVFYQQPGTNLSWCHECYDRATRAPATSGAGTSSSAIISLVDVSTGERYVRANLIKRTHDDVHGEEWVQCDECEGWSHAICSLFNLRKNDPNAKDKYSCPKCLLKQTNKLPCAPPVPGAAALPHSSIIIKCVK